MNLLVLRWLTTACAIGSVLSAPAGSRLRSSSDALLSRSDAQSVVETAQAVYHNNTIARLNTSNTSCNSETVSVRRAWDDLSLDQRSQYINAVKCLTTKPSRTPKDLAPGARSLHDDFVYAHINQTNFIHQSALLLSWHRQFIWAYEQTLRRECGYTGALPYWAWERHSENQSNSPVFQGGLSSFGGNGLYVPHGPTNGSTIGIDPPFFIPRPAGTGGGCVTDGAFADIAISLGPVDPANNSPDNVYGLKSNLRCIARDFYQPTSSSNLTYGAIANLYRMESIHDFHPLLEVTVHPDSHTFIGGDANDFYSSPNDPVFFLLHAQIDRIWTVWQGQDSVTRDTALDGTLTFANRPPSPNATLDSLMDMGLPAGGYLPISYAMLTTANDYCYMYA